MNGRCFHLALLGALLIPGFTAAQNFQARYFRVEEPTALKYHFYGLEAGLLAEQMHEETSFRDSDTRSTYDRAYVTPSLSLGTVGSIYHPDFLKFDLWGEVAYGWGEEQTDTEDSVTRNEISHFERLRGRLDLFSGKPLSGSAFGSYGRSYRDYDFFTRSTVESRSYGARLLYRTPSLNSDVGYSHLDEKELDSPTPSSTRQDLATYGLQQSRRHGGSSFNYAYSQTEFSGTDPVSGNVTRDHTVSASDQEQFGPGERKNLQTSASYSHRDAAQEQNDQVAADMALRVDHRRNLGSFYAAGFDRFSNPDFTSENYSGRAELWHQLYESLLSTVSADGSDNESTAGDDSAYTRRFGGGLEENYTKRLGDSHRLRVDAGASADNVEQTGSGRAVNERHQFPRAPDIEAFQLDLPKVIESSIIVKDAGDIRRFTRGLDYEVFPRGSRTEIRRISGGSIPEGSTVLVTYDAAPGVPGSYQTWTENLGVRLELWQNLWGLYGRLSYGFNNAPESLSVQELKIYTVGTDLNLSHASAGAEYEIYDSEDAYDRTMRFYQSAWVDPDYSSSLGVSLAQSFTEHVDEDRRERDYRYTAHYRRALTRHLQVSMKAGLDFRRGEGVDQDLAVLRPEFIYRIRQTTVEAYYDYEHNLYLRNEVRDKHVLASSLKRRF